MVSVVVTGSSGFLGSAIARELARHGHDVTGIDVKSADLVGVRTLCDDLGDPARLQDILRFHRATHIIHAGGISGPDVMPERPDALMQINVGGTLNLVSAAAQASVRTLVYCSSTAAAGSPTGDTAATPDMPLAPGNPYACSKAAAELILRGLWRKSPLDLCILRFPGIYGPGRKTRLLLTDMIDAAAAGQGLSLTDNLERSYIYIDDAAEAAIAACFSGRRESLVYYVTHPRPVAPEDLAAVIAEHYGVSAPRDVPPRIRVPAFDLTPAVRDFGFAPRTDHIGGLKKLIASRQPKRSV